MALDTEAQTGADTNSDRDKRERVRPFKANKTGNTQTMVTLYFAPDLLAQMDTAAANAGISRAALVREAVAKHLKRSGAKRTGQQPQGEPRNGQAHA